MPAIAIQTQIAGVKFRPIEAQVKAYRLDPDEPLVLVPEPDNQFDQYAVKVLTPDGLFLGYVPRTFSRAISVAIADGTEVQCRAGVGPLVIELESVPQDADEPH